MHVHRENTDVRWVGFHSLVKENPNDKFSLFFQSSLVRSPVASPNKDRYGDRFIPSRSGNTWETNFSPVAVRFFTKLLTTL